MIWEHSCGAVLYTLKDGEPYYVVVQQKAGNYSFPKGHMEEGETEIETARRRKLVPGDVIHIDGMGSWKVIRQDS